MYLGGGNLFNFHGIVEQWSGREIGMNKVLDDHYSHVRVVELVENDTYTKIRPSIKTTHIKIQGSWCSSSI